MSFRDPSTSLKSVPPRARVTEILKHLAFYMDSRNLNLGPHAYMAGTFTNMSQLSRPTYKCFVFFLPLKNECMCYDGAEGLVGVPWSEDNCGISSLLPLCGYREITRKSGFPASILTAEYLTCPCTSLEAPTLTSENGQYCLVLRRAVKCSQKNIPGMYYLRMRPRDKGATLRSVQPCSALSWFTLRPPSA